MKGHARKPRRIAIGLLALLFASAALPLSAQPASRAGHLLDMGHWSRGALERLIADGLLDAGDVLVWPVRQTRALSLFEEALNRVSAADPGARDRVAGWIARLEEESGAGGGVTLAATVDAGFRTRAGERIAGRLVPRAGGDFDYTGTVERPARRAVDASQSISLSLSRFTIAAARGERDEVRGRTTALYILYGTESLDLWAGRRPLAFGPAGRGGIVLGDETRLDGFGVELPAGFHLPGFLRALGPVRLSQTFARMHRSGPIEHPWFLATRVLISPSPSLAIGLNRAALFGGEGNQGVTLERAFWMLLGQTDIGSKDSDFENQVVSFDVRWHPGTSAWTVFGEYAFDDAGGAFIRVPALTLGATLARVPGLPSLAASAEITRFTPHCCGHPPWYRHGALAEGWTDRGVLLGHASGGEGTEAALGVRADLADARVIADARAYIRDRGPENLLAPEFEGRSLGAELRTTAAFTPHLRIILDLAGERFENGRTRHNAWIGLRAIL
ncbi:MAG: capsule assembly Wzi family protein [Longimicrobiales bacterium]